MSDELIRRLRDDATFWDAGNDIDSSEPLRKAADLIEQQAARIQALEAHIKELTKDANDRANQNGA